MIAALCDGMDPDVLTAQAVFRFRCISWGVLVTMPEIIVGGGPLDQVGAGRADLHTIATSCRVGECDAFFSHSWHDNARLKWEALTGWCTEFENTQDRPPTLWLDKVCIDQKNINADLQCLPIFLAACDLLLVISGETYTERLWCCVELFVHVQMVEARDNAKDPIVLTIGADSAEHARVKQSWIKFDATACKCFDQSDKTRMLAVVEQYPGGVTAFNQHIRDVAMTLFGMSRKSLNQRRSARSALRDSPGSSSWSASPVVPEPSIIPGTVAVERHKENGS